MTTPARGGRRGFQPSRSRALWLVALGVVFLAAILVAGVLAAPRLGFGVEPQIQADLKRELQLSHAPADVLDFYALRDYRPLWVKTSGRWPLRQTAALAPEARRVVAMAQGSELSGDRAATLRGAVARAAGGEPSDLARAELQLSLALTDQVLRAGLPEPAKLAFVDADLAPAPTAGAALEQAAAASSLDRHLARLEQVNPIYSTLRGAADAYARDWASLPRIAIPAGPAMQPGAAGERVRRLRQRLGLSPDPAIFDAALAGKVRRFQAAHGLAATGGVDAATLAALNRDPAEIQRLLTANLVRARALPAISEPRFVLVNAAAGELWLYEDGRPTRSMRVAIGTREEPTPMMAGLIRYLVVNPYWNVPVDMVRTSLAPKVIASRGRYFQTARFEALADWSDEADRLDPAVLDWPAVAAGTQELRVRQRPGGDNMMGTVKFMLPNELGIYLHDTPHKAVFAQSDRLVSAGCVRLENASDLAHWLLGADWRDPTALGMDERLDLRRPTPVYITYLTAAPGPNGLRFHPDVYGWDKALLAALS